MSKFLRISEAASLALHTVVFLGADSKRVVTTAEVAAALKASEAHLSKVLQRLAKVGLVQSVRGPQGGFVLARPCKDITLLAVYEAIEGPVAARHCLFSPPVCDGARCILGGLVKTVNTQVQERLARTKVSDLRHVFRTAGVKGRQQRAKSKRRRTK